MKYLDATNFILGMEITRDHANMMIFLNQRKYVEMVLQIFNMQESKSVNAPIPIVIKLYVDQCPKTQEEQEDLPRVPYASAVGSLMYAMVCNRPDIAHAVGVLNRYMSKLGKENWTAVKRVFRYLCGTTYYAIFYQGRPEPDIVINVHGFTDVDWVGDIDRKISTRGYVFNLFGGDISLMRKRQVVVALSSTEAKYMEAIHARK